MPPPRIRKAVVPAAGLGTRHFPASHAVKKELFPVVGLEVSWRDIDPMAEARQMRELVQCVTFAVQREQEGYGHAVYQSKAFAAGEPVLLCLGDHLFRGETLSPFCELADMAALSGGRSVSAVNRITPGELKGFGTIAGTRRAENPRLIDVSLIIEKPDVATACERLRVDGLEEDVFLGWFGMHLLAPSIYDILEEMIANNTRDNGEFQLTRAQEIQRQQEGYLALEMLDATRFDFGIPDDFVRSVQAFRGAF